MKRCDYKCPNDHRFEVITKDNETDIETLEKCPRCGKKAKRLPSLISFNFKGGAPTKKGN